MSNGPFTPTHLEQIEDALEERQNRDRRQQPSDPEKGGGIERRKQDRRKNVTNAS